MLIAAACDADRTIITERYEEAEFILVFETEDDSLVKEYRRAETSAGILAADFDEMFVECIVCGIMEREDFEPIALKQISRYNGSGLEVLEAVHAAELNVLPMITDFEGGTGCNDHDDEEKSCSGDCAACDEAEDFCKEAGKAFH